MTVSLTTALLWLVMQTTTTTTPAAASQPAALAVPTTRPVAAVWYEMSYPPTDVKEPKRLIVAVWGDGTIVWSDDRACGMEPYQVARIDAERVGQLLADLKAAEFFAEKRKVNFGPDASYTVLAAEDGAERQWLGSWHEPARDNPRSVVTERGIVAVPPGEKPPEPSAEYQRYLKVWSNSRRLIEQLIPEQGQPLETLDPMVFETGRQKR